MGLRSTIVLLPVLAACGLAHADNWQAWRGPHGTGVSTDQQLPLEWDATRNIRWHVPLPDRGNSTPIICNDRVFITQAIEKDNRRIVTCFARADGKLLWQSGVTCEEREPTNGQNPYCSASPVTDGQRVIAYFGSAGLFCFDVKDGKQLWHRDLGKVDSWQGSGSSPVICGKLCVINAGPGSEAALVACEIDTGRVAWKVVPPRAPGGGARGPGEHSPLELIKPPRPAVGKFDDAMWAADPRGAGGYLGSWSTPLLVRVGKRNELIAVHPLQVTAYEPQSGKEIWTCKELAEQAFASPTADGDTLVTIGRPVAGGGTRVTAIRLDADAAGDVTASHRLWQTKLPKECVGSPVIAGERIFLVTSFGSVICIDRATGKKFREKRLGGTGSRTGSWSSIVLVNDKLLIPNQSGEVSVIRADDSLEELAVNSIGDEITCGSLAISDGQIFLRTYQSLWCIAPDKR